MSIIPVSLLESELPDDAENNNQELNKAVARATGFVNSWTSKKYDPWDDYDSDDDTTRAPNDIVEITVEVAKLFYRKIAGDVWRDGEDGESFTDSREAYKTELEAVNITPVFLTQTVSLDSNDSMVIGSRTTTAGIWTRVLPANAFITSAESNIYTYGDEFCITKGGANEDEYSDAWYLRASTSDVEGTLSYMRTFRKDMADYLAYTRQ